jgi:hypothetical protein
MYPTRELQPLAAEVIELGEALFDGLIDALEDSGSDGEQASSLDDVRTAATEFFHALRLLLWLNGEPDGS